MTAKHFHGEIAYHKEGVGNVHSDLCFEGETIPDDYRALLHEALDEFLNNYDPNGVFGVGGFNQTSMQDD